MSNPHFDILQRVAQELGTPPIANLGDIEVRELPYALVGTASGPYCFVCIPPGEAEVLKRQTFAKGAWWAYPVLVLLISASNRAVASGLEARLQTRYDVRQRLFVPTLSGLTTHDCDAEPQAIIDVQTALGTNWIVSGFQFRLVSAEQRTA